MYEAKPPAGWFRAWIGVRPFVVVSHGCKAQRKMYSFGIFHREAITHRCAVVLYIKAIFFQFFREGKSFNDVGQMVERVAKLTHARRGTVTETRIVWRDYVIVVRQKRNQVAKHLRRSWKAMQQKIRRLVRVARLAVKNFQIVDFQSVVSHRPLV